MGKTDVCVGSPSKKHIFGAPLGAFYDVANPTAPYAIATCRYCGYQRHSYLGDISGLRPKPTDFSGNADFVMRTK